MEKCEFFPSPKYPYRNLHSARVEILPKEIKTPFETRFKQVSHVNNRQPSGNPSRRPLALAIYGVAEYIILSAHGGADLPFTRLMQALSVMTPRAASVAVGQWLSRLVSHGAEWRR